MSTLSAREYSAAGPTLAPRLGLSSSTLLRAWRHGLLGAALPASSSRAGAAPLLGAARPASLAGASAARGGAARASTTIRAGAAASFPLLELLLLLLLRRGPLARTGKSSPAVNSVKRSQTIRLAPSGSVGGQRKDRFVEFAVGGQGVHRCGRKQKGQPVSKE